MAHRIIKNIRLNPLVCQLEIEAKEIAKKALPGQFIILRLDEKAERIPLTIYKKHSSRGTIELIVQEAGTTTLKLCSLQAGLQIMDIIGPLGEPTPMARYGKVICVGGGVGIAEVYPVAEALTKTENQVISIIGARNKEMLILEEEMRSVSAKVYMTTDDGSYGQKGFVSDVLKELLNKDKYDIVFAVGPIPMMRSVVEITRFYKLKTIVSLNSIMVDGTGMCGSCRVTVGNKVKFVCVDGPDFDGHQVDFKELAMRQVRFLDSEKISLEKVKGNHRCQQR